MGRYAMSKKLGPGMGRHALSQKKHLGLGRYVVMAVAVVVFLVVALMLLISALIFMALAFVVGIPLYLAGKRLMRRHGLSGPRLNPTDRIKNLYVEGKIDLSEFERRVGHLVSRERG
jgi:hypothetical protein